MAAQNGDITNQAKNFYNKLYDELKKLTESESIISSQVHDAIVQRLQDSKLIEEETPQGILYDLRYWWVDCGADYSINYIENMKAVSNESLKKYINEYLLNRRPVIFLYVNPQLYEAQSTYFRLSNFININDYEPFWFMQNK